MNHSETQPYPELERLQRRAFLVGGVALGLCAVGATLNGEQFLRSYLLGYLLWIGVALGSASLLMLHHLVGGGWGFVIRRSLESGARTIPLMLLLILPLMLGLKSLYLWAQPEIVAQDQILQNKSAYLNIPFFIIRTGLYFAIWGVLAHWLSKWSLQQDHSNDPKLTRRLQILSGPGLGLMGLTMTFASVDWVMSLDPHWYSTMYGFLFMIGNVLTTLAFAICALAFLSERKPLSDVVSASHFHDLGNLLMAFVMLWAYLAFSQYLIIWSGNLPEEVTWYVDRTGPGWAVIAVILIVFHFAVPFLLLLSRRTKRAARTLVSVAGFLLLMRLLDLFWVVVPSFHHAKLHIHWMDVLAPIGIGGVWLGVFVWQLRGKPLLPLNDPNMSALAASSGGHG